MSIILLLLTAFSVTLAEAETPRFEPAECPIEDAEWLATEHIDCGYLFVPENRKKPESREIRLAVAILRSTSADPEPDPVIFLHGGPGLASLSGAQDWASSRVVTEIRKERDYILFDQRGTGFSEPGFCPDLDESWLQSLSADLTVEEYRQQKREAVAACRDWQLQQGVDLAAHNSIQSAADLRDLLDVLTYDEWNLFGLSYGTRLALVAARDHPHGIRSVILDSALPVQARDFEDSPANVDRAFDELFAACEAEEDCHRAYPRLKEDLIQTVEGLQRQPLIVSMSDLTRFPAGTLAVNAYELNYVIASMVGNPGMRALLPLLITEVKARNADVLRPIIDAQAEALGGHINHAIMLSTLCYDETAYSTRAAYERVAAQHPVYTRNPLQYLLDVCDIWPSGMATPDEIKPYAGDIPTLILHGAYDHATPPHSGRDLVGRLSNGHFFEIDGAGHFASARDECAKDMLIGFVDNPGSRPDDSCLGNATVPAFVTDVYVTASVYRMAKALMMEQSPGHLAWLGAVILILLSPLALAPGEYLLGRIKRRAQDEALRPRRGARWLAISTSLLALGFLAGLALVLIDTVQTSPMTLGFGLPGSARMLLFVPFVVIPLALGVLVTSAKSWLEQRWTVQARVHYSLLALSGLGFLAFIGYWGLY